MKFGEKLFQNKIIVGTTLQPFKTTSQQCFKAVRVAQKIVPRKITFTSSIKHEIRLFSRRMLQTAAQPFAPVVKKRQRTVQKGVIHVQSCCFAF